MTSNPEFDRQCMSLALQSAKHGEGHVEPNPMVGCVLAKGGEIIGQGYHEKFGQAHAEVNAITSVVDPESLRGATAYVTLEPCCHHGKTPPCSQALIDAGVQRVVVAMEDPFAKVDGGGIAHLRDAGIVVETGLLREKAAQLVAPYLKLIKSKRPYVIAKWAMTIDGRIATVTGDSQWITSQESRSDAHRLRGRVDAIVVGMGTVRADNPTLTARPPGQRVATRVVLCDQNLPELDCNLINTIEQAPLLLVASANAKTNELDRLEACGTELLRCDTHSAKEMATALIEHLGAQQATNVMIEGGGKVLGSFLDQGLVDECHVYIGAKIFGGTGAPGPIAGTGLAMVRDACDWNLDSVQQFGDDVRLVYRKVEPTV